MKLVKYECGSNVNSHFLKKIIYEMEFVLHKENRNMNIKLRCIILYGVLFYEE